MTISKDIIDREYNKFTADGSGDTVIRTLSNDAVFNSYKISDLDSGTISYFGYLKADGSWYILELTSTTARYAKGSSAYTTSWTGRAGLTYDYYNTVFG